MLWLAHVAALALGPAGARPGGAASPASASCAAPPARPVRLAVVGDMHGQWDEGDASALRGLRPAVDAVLFVGDFGDEDVATVEAVARCETPGERVSIFGNHDAWFSLDPRKRRRPKKSARGRHGGLTPLERQRELLAECNLEYAKRELPALGLSVVGGRPYSIGGPIWPQFYLEQYGLRSPLESGDRMGRIAARAQSDAVVFLAHNGPTGLGAERADICGRDWAHRAGARKGQTGGDWGDKDLATAVRMARGAGKRVPLVAFGHMHRRLIGGGLRTMVVHDARGGTVYLNAAVVPRWRGAGVEPLAYDAAAQQPAADAAGGAAGAAGAAEPSASAGGGADAAAAASEKQHWFAIVELEPLRPAAPADAPPASPPAEQPPSLEVSRVLGCWVGACGRVCEEEVWYVAEGLEQRRGGGAGGVAAQVAAQQPQPAEGAAVS